MESIAVFCCAVRTSSLVRVIIGNNGTLNLAQEGKDGKKEAYETDI